MKTFVDTAGRTWNVVISVSALKRIRSLAEVDLMALVTDNGTLLGRLTTDPILLCDVLFAVCKEQADSQGVTDEQFGAAMAGDAVEAATDALLEELTAFFPTKKRPLLEKVLAKMKRLDAMALELGKKKLDDPKLDEELERELLRVLNVGPSSGNGPESSDSTPAPSPSPS